jgi:hypothetical protein
MKWVTNLDNSEKKLPTLNYFRILQQEFPTPKKIAPEFRDKINYSSFVSFMYNIFKSTGFKYRKGKTNARQKFLMGSRDIIGARIRSSGQIMT